MSTSFTLIVPAIGLRIPTSVFANVDFPAPFGPMIVVTEPSLRGHG